MNIFLKRHLRPKEGDSFLYKELLKEKVIDFSEMEKIRAVRWRITETAKSIDPEKFPDHRKARDFGAVIFAVFVTSLCWFAVFVAFPETDGQTLGAAIAGSLVAIFLLFATGVDLFPRAFFRRLREKSWQREPILAEDVVSYIHRQLGPHKKISGQADIIEDPRRFGAIADLSPTFEKIDGLNKKIDNIDKKLEYLGGKRPKLKHLKDSKEYSQTARMSLKPVIERAEKEYFSASISTLWKKREKSNHHRQKLYIAVSESEAIAEKLVAGGSLGQYSEQEQMLREVRKILREIFPGARLSISSDMKNVAANIKFSLQKLMRKVDEANKLAARSTEELYEEWQQKKKEGKQKQAEEETETSE